MFKFDLLKFDSTEIRLFCRIIRSFSRRNGQLSSASRLIISTTHTQTSSLRAAQETLFSILQCINAATSSARQNKQQQQQQQQHSFHGQFPRQPGWAGTRLQWNCRKIWGQGQSARSSLQIQAPRQFFFTFHFWQKYFILDDAELACRLIQRQFWMKECDILLEGKTYSDPSYIFSGVKIPDPQYLRPC